MSHLMPLWAVRTERFVMVQRQKVQETEENSQGAKNKFAGLTIVLGVLGTLAVRFCKAFCA
jgi:hypothetical protein